MAEPESKIPISFKLEGSPRDQGLVRFSDFATFVEGTLATLRALEREATNAAQAQIEYRVTQLEISSAAFALEAIDDPTTRETEKIIAARLVEGLAAVRDGLVGIAAFDPSVRNGLSKMLSPLRRGVQSVSALIGDTPVTLVGRAAAKIRLAEVFEESAAVGSFSGSVDALNVHGDHFFYLYPPVGPTKIKCVFSPDLLDEVKSSIKRYVTIFGLIEYAEPSAFPVRIVVDRLVAHPPAVQLPSLSSLWGISPSAGGPDEVIFVRHLRDAE